MEHYGVKHPSQSKEILQQMQTTCFQHLGVSNPYQSNEIKLKIKSTNLTNHGVEYFAQSYEYHKNKKHKFHSEKYPELTFDSTWEVKVYEFCRDNNIHVEYSPEISYPYEYDGRIWTYHPDFLINGKVYEVKGDQFFRINESTGKEEMVCPYRETNWSDEYYKWKCKLYEAKHQCMLSNNVTILRKRELNNLRMVFL